MRHIQTLCNLCQSGIEERRSLELPGRSLGLLVNSQYLPWAAPDKARFIIRDLMIGVHQAR